MEETNSIYVGDVMDGLGRMRQDGIVANTCVTSPPYYGLRDYGVKGQIGLEKTPEEFIARLVGVFARVRDVLADDGTLWVNIGSSYCSGDRPGHLRGTYGKALSDSLASGLFLCRPGGVHPDCPCCRILCNAIHPSLLSFCANPSQIRAHTGIVSPFLESSDSCPQKPNGLSCSSMLGIWQEFCLSQPPRFSDLLSTMIEFFQQYRDDNLRACILLAFLSLPSGRTFFPYALDLAHKALCIDGMLRLLHFLESRNRGIHSFFLAYPNLTIESLKYKSKDLIPIPFLLALALQADGWYLRQDIIWSKPNPMPESVTDRCTKAHEYIFMLSKSPRYYYDHESIKERAVTPAGSSANDWAREGALPTVPGQMFHQHRKTRNPIGGSKSNDNGKGHYKTRGGTEYIPSNESMRNKRSVWEVATKPYKGAHFAVFPEELITPCVLAGCPPGGIVLDPFMGSGTTAMVAIQNGRRFAGCELNSSYVPLQRDRLGIFQMGTVWK